MTDDITELPTMDGTKEEIEEQIEVIHNTAEDDIAAESHDDDDPDESPEIYRDHQHNDNDDDVTKGSDNSVKPKPKAKRRGRPNDRKHPTNRSAISRRGPDFRTPPLIVHIEEEDASFVLGTAGRTKKKLARVSGAEIVVTEDEHNLPLIEVYGPEAAKERAKEYIGFVVQQRRGVIRFDTNCERDDLTIINVPSKCIGYITGRRGVSLRAIEEEWSTLMFFMNNDRDAKDDRESEQLAIFGSERNRKGSELKVMSTVEQKQQGQGVYTKDLRDKFTSQEMGFNVDYFPIAEEDYSYALGKHGNTRKKLAKASGAILEYIGNWGFIAGNKDERSRAMSYFEWLKRQRTESISVNIQDRTDAVSVDVPSELMPTVTGKRGVNLRVIESETGTFIFINGIRKEGPASSGNCQTLLIFSYDRHARDSAVTRVKEVIRDLVDGRGRGGGCRDYYRREEYLDSPYHRGRSYYPPNDGYGSPLPHREQHQMPRIEGRNGRDHRDLHMARPRSYTPEYRGPSRGEHAVHSSGHQYLDHGHEHRGLARSAHHHHHPTSPPRYLDRGQHCINSEANHFHDSHRVGRGLPPPNLPMPHYRRAQRGASPPRYVPTSGDHYHRRPVTPYDDSPRGRYPREYMHYETGGPTEYYEGGRDRSFPRNYPPRGHVPRDTRLGTSDRRHLRMNL